MWDNALSILNEFLQLLFFPIAWAIKHSFLWILEYLFDNLSPEAFESLTSLCPDISKVSDSPAIPYLAFVNEWVPLDTAAFCLGLYIQFIIQMILIKLIIKLFVPFLG